MSPVRRNLAAALSILAIAAPSAAAPPSAGAAAVGEPYKIVLPFFDSQPTNRLISDHASIPEGKRFAIDEVSVFLSLGDTDHVPPVKALAYVETEQILIDAHARYNVKEPLGAIDWVDMSEPPYAGATTGMLRTSMNTFTDHFVRVFVITNEFLQIGFAGDGSSPISHAVLVGRLVDLPR